MDANVSIVCKYCDKKYSHRSSLSRHLKMKHVNIDEKVIKKSVFDAKKSVEKSVFDAKKSVEKSVEEKVKKIISCKFCKKEFRHKQSKYNHEKKCKIDRPSYDDIKEQLDNVREQLLNLMNRKFKINLCKEK